MTTGASLDPTRWARRFGVAALFAVGLGVASLTEPGAQAPQGQQIRFAEQVQAYLDRDRTSPPPAEGVLFIGSSIFRQWSGVAEQMAPLPAFNRAFGGSRTWEILHYMDRLVLPYRPRIIVYYCGSNDINANEPADAIVDRVRAFVERVHRALPATRVFFVSVNKAPQKREKWDVVDAVNREVAALAATLPHLEYIDVNPALFDASGEPRLELYRNDLLHFHAPAYDEFTKIIKPVVMTAWEEMRATRP
jgi:hypothetical protein